MSKLEPRNFKPDYRIAKLSLLGILGFFLGCVFLFYEDLSPWSKKNSAFHEVQYVPKYIIHKRILFAIDSLEKLNFSRTAEIKKNKSIAGSSNNAPDNNTDDSIALRTSELESRVATDVNNIKTLKNIVVSYENTSLNDTTSFKKLNNALHFSIGPKELKEIDNRFENNKNSVFEINTEYALKDPALSFSLYGAGSLPVKPAQSDIAFTSKYPNAGIWILLLLVFCSFLCIVISTAFFLRNRIMDLFDPQLEGFNKKSFNWMVVYTFLGLLLIWGLGKLSFNDEDVVKSIYFMKNIKISMMLIQLLGFLGGASCLAGFIHSAAMLGFFASEIKTIKTTINKQQAELAALKEGNQDAGQAIGADTQEKKEDQSTSDALTINQATEKRDKEIFKRLQDFFQTYFILSALILSLLVLCTGGLYSILNSLDFVKLLTDDWGYSPARTDFIYLYGGMYTFVLLLVYVPAKMRFSEISFEDDEHNKEGKETNDKWYKLLKDPFGKLKDLLIATSPLLASLVQSLFDALFN